MNTKNFNFSGSDAMLQFCLEVIQKNRIKFEEYKQNSQKLMAVKMLKEYSGCGLKEAKEIIDEIWNNNFSIKENRKEKLERLAKIPLIEEMVEKISKFDEFGLKDFFIKFTLDELLDIDEKLEKT
jgi:predicted AAA+ superfamily ATPase